jgi:hypothetical protein
MSNQLENIGIPAVGGTDDASTSQSGTVAENPDNMLEEKPFKTKMSE